MVAAALSATLTVAWPAHAADDAVRIECPDLTIERAAELESRVRANLLTAEPAATVTITCGPERADVRVAAATEAVTVHVPLGARDSFRDDVLRGVEEALQELARHPAQPQAGPEANANSPEPEPATVAPAEPPPPIAAPASVQPFAAQPVAARSQPPPVRRPWTEIRASGLGELWRDRVAIGGALGVGYATPSVWLAARTAVLRPAASSADYGATEWHASVELGLQPAFAAGFRASIGLGPSLLFVDPRGLTAINSTMTSALFFALHVERPFWLGRFAVLPDVGVRLFPSESGVRIDTNERLKLSGLLPVFNLGVAYRVE